ncbi:hypothetical protein B5C34_12915 [Pacificimonas flava]|uniref:DUF4440 domain-containing protein n=2 Tax=Pacificimonas TaxID=1960290 RepID=A0A219B7B3_9SPHN|nr:MULTISPECIES: hypothetical protein [Pacificimonas]MBZ6378430.1 hypothetical protein [Pacificimonas aurantium]OWV34270.1 hypothetical protein B5C34_12915 [Pacificimonas flava]
MRVAPAALLLLAACSQSVEEGEPTPEAVAAAAEGPRAVVDAYYAALNSGEYDTAWQLWGKDPEADSEEFETFVEGFEDTELAIAEVGEAGAERMRDGWVYAEVPVRVEDLKSDGTGSGYSGTYTVRRSVVDEESWHIYEGDLTTRS